MEEKKVMSAQLKGLIIGLILVVISIIIQFTGIKRDSWPVQLLSMCLLIGGIIWSCWIYGKQKDGFVTFGNVFGHGFKTTAVIAVIVIIFTAIFFIAFPEFKEQALEEGRKKAEESSNQSEEQIEQGMKTFGRLFLPIVLGSILVIYAIIGVIASLIGAAITKKKPVTPFDGQ